MHYSGMKGNIELGTGKMDNMIRNELDLPDTVTYLCLSTCTAHIPQDNGNTWMKKLSILDVAPVLSRTKARRNRFGVCVW
jgi:hypothetical protein